MKKASSALLSSLIERVRDYFNMQGQIRVEAMRLFLVEISASTLKL
jgi:hypothetical protein